MFKIPSAVPRQSDAATPQPTIAVDELRVGMFVHLDGGWLSHPFAMSSFRLTHAQQIATLRGLKLARVRWSPELSVLAPPAGLPAEAGLPEAPVAPTAPPTATAAAAAAAKAADVPAAALPLPVAVEGPPDTRGCGDGAHSAAAGGCAANVNGTAEASRRDALAAQRQMQQQCQQHFAEATAAWRRAGDALLSDPAAARAGADALAGSLTDKLTAEGEVGIRLLPSAGNDRAAAHALNVTVVAMLLGRALGLAGQELVELALGALLHDVGKLELPARVRHPDADAALADLSAYREHVQRGVAAARRMGLPEGAQGVIAQHHEHADASGFPQRISGDRIALAGRIVAIVNRYDNLCNPANRAVPLTPHEAVAMLFAQGRTRFDAVVLNAFIRMMGVYPAGSLVQLTDERYAMVVTANSSRPLKPRVLVHDASLPHSEALLLDLEREPDIGVRRSLTAAKMPAAALEYLDPRPRVAYFFEPLSAPVALASAPAMSVPAASASRPHAVAAA